jgi:hypothetical protein
MKAALIMKEEWIIRLQVMCKTSPYHSSTVWKDRYRSSSYNNKTTTTTTATIIIIIIIIINQLQASEEI